MRYKTFYSKNVIPIFTLGNISRFISIKIWKINIKNILENSEKSKSFRKVFYFSKIFIRQN